MKLDLQKLDRKFQTLKEYVQSLREYGLLPHDLYFGQRSNRSGAKYDLQIAIQCCIDIANMLIAAEGWRQPRDYFDAFRILGENGVVPEAFLPTLEEMVKTRNMLAHVYERVDDVRVNRIIREDLDDFGRFTRHVLDYVRTQGYLSEEE